MKKNVASQVVGAQMITAADGTAFTGSVTCYVTGDGGTQAAGSVGSGACTHEGNGFHTYAPAQAETNYDHVAFTFIGTGAIPVTVQIYPGFPQTGDNYARLGAPAGASVAADIAAVKSDTAAILTDTGTSGVLISAGTGSGQLDVTSGRIKADLTHILATALDDDIISAVGLTTIAENLSIFFGSNANSTNNVNGYSSIAVIESSTSIIQGTAGIIDAMIQLDGADYEFKASALKEVWAVAARTLTAATNITSTGGTITVNTGAVDANVTKFGGAAGTFASGRPEVNTTHYAGTLQSADPPTDVENADALLGRNVAGGSSSGRLVKEALYFLRNKWAVVDTTLTVYATDDTTAAWTSTVTVGAGADPITASDPAG